MSDGSLDGRRFTDQEVGEILKRAVQDRPSAAVTRTEGVTLAELKAIAEEVGIDPVRLEDAAHSLIVDSAGEPSKLGIFSRIVRRERRFHGAVRPEDSAEALALIRQELGRKGEAQEIQGSLDWGSSSEMVESHVSLSVRDGATTVRASSNFTGAMVSTLVPVGFFSAFAFIASFINFANDEGAAGILVAAIVVPMIWAVVTALFRRVGRSEARKLEQLLDKLERLARPTEPAESESSPERSAG